MTFQINSLYCPHGKKKKKKQLTYKTHRLYIIQILAGWSSNIKKNVINTATQPMNHKLKFQLGQLNS